MLERILREIKNYFIQEVYVGDFSIQNGSLDVSFLKNDQYFKIHGSTFNDGVYQFPTDSLKDEDFSGEVWALAIPATVISLADDIGKWLEENDPVLKTPFSSESFGGYSYVKQSPVHSNNSSGTSAVSWKTIFADDLNEWRKIRYESSIRRNGYLRNS